LAATLQRRRRHRDVFGERAGTGHAEHRHARLERGDIAGCGVDHACEFRARHEGQRILGLIQPCTFSPSTKPTAAAPILTRHLAGGDRRSSISLIEMPSIES
jgi:hypothetical protein